MKLIKISGLSVLVLSLSGCLGGNDFADIQAYMDEVRARPQGSIEPLPKVQPYEPFTYQAANMRAPFQPPVKVELNSQGRQASNVKPDEARVKQFLEGFNVEIFEMVGTLGRDADVFALVRGAGGVHRVRIGDYLGRNHGRVVSIDESRVDIVEIVPDGEGGWLERPRSLTLKERT